MSNRTFRRDQSPCRPATSSGPGDVPPLPSMPPQYTPTPQKPFPSSTRRSVSMQPPMRPMSPPRRTGARGISVDREAMRSPVRPVSSRGHGLSTVPELERSASRNSINFSYPMNSRPNSPSPPPSPPIRREVSTSLAQQLSESPGSQAGNRLVKGRGPTDKRNTGTAGAGQPRTAVAAAQAAILPVPTSTQDQMPSPPRPVMVKRPSTVPEDYQGEERAEANIDARYRMDRTRTRNLSPSTDQNRSPTIRATITPEPQIIKSPPTPERSNPPLLDQTVMSPASNRSVESERELAKLSRVRQPSSSPGRSARFSTQLSVIGTGEQLDRKSVV